MEKKNQILKVAIDLFARYGYQNVDYDEIAFTFGDKELVRSFFPTKESIYLEIFSRLPDFIVHYDPSRDDLHELLKNGERTRDILARFVTYYDMREEREWRSLYRLAFMEQHRHKWVGDVVFEHLVRPPRDNAARMMGYMADEGLIPQGDFLALADVWSRTTLMYERLYTDNNLYVNREDYLEQTKFFIDLAQQGVRIVDITGLVPPLSTESSFVAEDDQLQVLNKAMELFLRDGYTQVSMPQIAIELEMPLSRLFSLYTNKSDILNQALEIVHERREYGGSCVFTAALDMEPRAAVLHLVDNYAALRDKLTLEVYTVVYKEQYSSEDLGDIVAGFILREVDAITQILDDLATQGKIEPCESRRIAVAFVFCMCMYNIGDTVFGTENFDNRHYARLRAVALILSLIKRRERHK